MIVLGSAALWIYALSGVAEHRPPGTLDDGTFPAAAQQICLATGGRLAQLPKAYETSSPTDRAAAVEQSDRDLTAMLQQLRAVAPPTDSRDGTMIDEWLGDWETYIGNRDDYVSRLRSDPNARFYVAEKDKAQITQPVDRFAQINYMEACITPGDLS